MSLVILYSYAFTSFRYPLLLINVLLTSLLIEWIIDCILMHLFFTEDQTHKAHTDLQLFFCLDRDLRLWFSFTCGNLVSSTLEFCSGGLYGVVWKCFHVLKSFVVLSVSAMADVVVRPASPSQSISLLEIKAETRMVLKSFLRHSLSIPPGERPGRIGGEYNDPNKYRWHKSIIQSHTELNTVMICEVKQLHVRFV